ncbi:MAG: veratrol--corrinoid protein metyltransferase, partial [Oscillospiraceae bacterium]|nr:veratrol--corrinoid protein metyltransferase [Oscillospiraceae bacterium]
GIPIQFHNCGRCEDFLDDMRDIGTRLWDPAQPTNNQLAIKEKYGRDLAIVGCYQWTPHDGYTEDELRGSVRECIDSLAPNGGFAFTGGVMTRYNDHTFDSANEWIREEAYSYCKGYYLR